VSTVAKVKNLFLPIILLLFTGLSINAHAGPVDVPDVVGLTEAAATADIEGAGLTVGTVTTEASDTVPVGIVISQDPAAGTSVDAGSAVNLAVSSGPALTAVPDVVSLSQADATTAITGAGLTVGTVTTAASDTVPADHVISQNPAAGASVPEGSAVDLVVSSGPESIVVPNVVGESEAAAEAAITGAGLTVGTVTTASSDTVPAGDVISQNPAGGTSVAAGTAVDLVVSSGVSIVVPNVVGQSEAAAEAAITGAGLAVGTVTTVASDTVPAGDVISQNPAGGTSVPAGTAVDLVISSGSSGPAPVVVPDVVGETQAAATTIIETAGLVVGTVTTAASDTVPAGNVISQDPAAGTSVAAGSAVDLVVSSGSSGPAPVVVPNVVGESEAAAEAAITGAGLTVGAVTTVASDTVPAGNVISQDPAAGTSVAAGSAVDLVVSSGSGGPAPVVVPNVVGESQAAAEAAISGAGLTVGTVTTAASDTVPAGNVISQDPAAGTSVAAGSAVDLVVSSGSGSQEDCNGDGISDDDSRELGLDPCDPDGDTDKDELSDVEETGGDPGNPQPIDSDSDGIIDALEPGDTAFDASTASGLAVSSGVTASVTTAAGETLSQVSAADAINVPSSLGFPFGIISYTTTSPVGGSVTVRTTFDADLPDDPVVYKVDKQGIYRELPTSVWKKVSSRAVDITLRDGDPRTDLDGEINGSIDDPVGVGLVTGSGGSGGCTLSTTARFDPIWLFLLVAPGVGYLRRRVTALKGAAGR